MRGITGVEMIDVKQRKVLFAVLMSLTLFAACKGESPTSPTTTPPTTSTSPTPPVGASVTLTVTNASPLVNSTSTVTATVSENGQPVPNGTAVQFSTTLGTFTDVGSSGLTIIKTTTNGVASATLTSGAAGTAVITATVNNVSKTTNVVFSATPVTPPAPNTTPTISSINPSTGRPQGGETIVINGTNFRAPARVLFTCVGSTANPPDPAVCGGQGPKEALVTSVTPTQIQAVTPSFNVPTGQAVTFSIQVIVGAGTPNEQTVTQSSSFTFTSPTLTPSVTTVTPATGPIEGGTRITIIGSNFQAPVQVTMGGPPSNPGGPLTNMVELQVISTRFDEIIAITPEFRLIDPTLSAGNGSVVLRVLNVASAQDDVLEGGFRYIPRMQITAITPAVGSALGGSQVIIDGLGFDDPVQVTVAGIPAQVTRVSGTQVVARTGALASPCSATAGPVTVTNVNTGDTATSVSSFSYIAVSPSITGVSSGGTIIPGSTVAVTVLNPGVGPLGNASVAFNVGSSTVTPTPSTITAGTGSQTFNVVVPTTITFPTAACDAGGGVTGRQFIATSVPLLFNNITTSCTATFAGGITVNPPTPNPCVAAAPAASVVAPATGCAAGGSIASAGATSGTATITLGNAAGSSPLTISAITVQNASNATITVTPAAPQTINGGTTRSFTVTIDPTAAGPVSGQVVFTTNDPNNPTLTVCVSATGT